MTDKDPLFVVPEPTTKDRDSILEIYRLLVEMADKVSERRQSANAFYLSVNSALIGASAYFGATSSPDPLGVSFVSIAGIAVALLWRRNIQSYRDLNAGKFHVITELERHLPIAPFRSEWWFLERPKPGRYRQFHSVEGLIPPAFAALHLAQLARSIPWTELLKILRAFFGVGP
jgi:hypothetical protein